MVITIEPGIYIPSESPCDKKWWGISVRIEDDALITRDGYELLSSFAPRSIADIEKMIAEKTGCTEFHSSLRGKEKSKMEFIHPAFENSGESYMNNAIDVKEVSAFRNELSNL